MPKDINRIGIEFKFSQEYTEQLERNLAQTQKAEEAKEE